MNHEPGAATAGGKGVCMLVQVGGLGREPQPGCGAEPREKFRPHFAILGTSELSAARPAMISVQALITPSAPMTTRPTLVSKASLRASARAEGARCAQRAPVRRLPLLQVQMVGKSRAAGGGSGGARKGSGPKPKMDLESIAKREKKAQRKIVVQAAAEETARCEAEQSELRKNRNLRPRTNTSSARASAQLSAPTTTAAAGASPSPSPSTAAAAKATARLPAGSLLSYFSSGPA